MLGSNDTKPENWQDEEKFTEAYNKLLDSYLQKDKKPTVYLCTVATAFSPDGITEGLTSYDVQPSYVEAVADIIRDIADERSLPVIEINNLTENRRDLFGKDHVHPNKYGAKAIAEIIYEAIK
jgi:lysophospholipase L1-like esterase